jgi:5-methylcytosine-specific restriction endonuclease McrA
MEPRCLVLTPFMTVNRIASWMEAVTLWYTEKAEILESWEATVSSAHMTMRIPSVIRLKRQIKRDKTQVKFSRQSIYARDNYTCQYCGHKFAAKDLTYDHVLPRCKGGKTTWLNVVAADRKCNTRKGRHTPEEAGMKLLRKPFVPKTLPLQPVLLDMNAVPELWKPYLGVAQVA